jgi:putative Ig domain-containing protein/Big-like domain-containing protein
MVRRFFLTAITLLLFITPTALGSAFAGDAADGGGYALVLVDSNSKGDLAEARDFIVAQGGSVAVVVPPHAILGWISPEVGARILGKRGIRSIHRSAVDQRSAGFTDRETQIAIGMFNEIVSGRRARQARRDSKRPSGLGTARPGLTDCAMPPPAINRDDFIRNLRLMGAEESAGNLQSQVTPHFFSNSDTMDGTVAVAVFLIESTGGVDPNVYTWSQADQTSAISQVIEGLNWWVEQSRAFNLARPLQFTVVPFLATNPACQQPYEPILHPGRDASLWIDQIMNNVGASAGDTFVRVASFDQRLKDQHRANWAYSMFIAYNPPPAATAFTDGRASWAYIGGPHVNSLFRSFGWPLARITSHEAGHIFYACDEYFQPGYQTCSCSCAPEIRPQAANGNCQDAVCGLNSVGCVMRLNELGLCPFTVAQIGWTGAVPKPAPSPPASLIASGSSPSQVSLIWQDTSNVEDGFQIERRGGSSADYSQIGVVSRNTTGFIDAGSLANTAYAYRVRAFNSTGTSSYSNEATVVTPTTSSALSISTTSLPDATVGVSYSRTLVASGGRPSYSWLVESGALPPGLSMSQSGTISGTPSTAGTSNFSLRVTDTDGGSTAKALTLVVKPAAPLTITTSQLPKGSVGATYSQNLGASGGQTPYTWSIQSGKVPEGMTLNQTGVISGTPEQAGSSSFVLRLTDATDESVTATLSIVVNPSALFLSLDTTSLSDAVMGRDYSQTLSATGGNPPYRWELTGGKLPDGLRLSETGVISGRPTIPGEVEFDVRVSDQSGLSVTRSLSIDVDPPPQFTILTESLLPVAAIGVPYRVELKATAGTPPYRWVKKKKKKKFGVLPDGITVSSDGTLSGTPTAQGVFNFTLRAFDANESLASSPFTIEVGPPPPPLAIRTEALPQALEGLPYNGALEAFGGIGPYTWALESGALPAGLTMTSEGIISGRATTSGVGSFTVRVRDALGTSTVKALFIVVSTPPPPLVILTVSLPETSAERFYSQTLVAAGGVAPYAWSITSGSLATGLNISANGTISGTPSSPGTSVFVVRVTDSAQQTVTRTLAITVKPADKLAPFGNLETPDFRATLNNTATGSGWALDNVGVTKVEVLIDNQKISEGIHGLSRPDIGSVWGSFPNAAQAGFSFSLDTTRFSNGEHTLSIRVLDAAGNATLIGARPVVVQNQVLRVQTVDLLRGKKGEPYSMQLLAANGRPPYSWAIATGSLPSGVSLNTAGVISGTPTVFGSFGFSVRVTDSSGVSAIASLTLTILPDIEPLRIVSSGPQIQGSTGVEYSQQLLFGGGVGPRVWSMGSGSLPPGLTLSSASGVISGAPTNPGTFNFTVRLTDSTQTTVTSNPLAITVVPGPLIILSTGDLPDATAGTAYSFLLQKKGGAPPYTWAIASGALPVGLSLNAATGVIGGTPTEDGTFSFTVRLTDAQPIDVESTLTITVDPAPLVITSTGDLADGELNIDYTYQLTFSGGRGPYVWAVLTGTLPAGLTLNAETGLISGKPTATGTFTFTVSLTDDQPVTVQSQQLRIAITP